MAFDSILCQFFRLGEAEGYVTRSNRTRNPAVQRTSGGGTVGEGSADEN